MVIVSFHNLMDDIKSALTRLCDLWQVGKELMIPGGAKVIDASGKLVMPGGIDTSVHLQGAFMNATIQDDFYSGTKVHTHTNIGVCFD